MAVCQTIGQHGLHASVPFGSTDDRGRVAQPTHSDQLRVRYPSIMPRRRHYHVYVVELSKDVLLNARFMRSNPCYLHGKPCVYVGMTGLDPDVRFDKHKAGIQANRFVKEFGLRLMPELYALYNPTKSIHLRVQVSVRAQAEW